MASLVFYSGIVAGLVLLAVPVPALAGELTGKAQVIDGDSLRLGQTEIGLYGIDAPELEQTCKTRKGKLQHCGDLARQSLRGLVRGREIVCKDPRPDPEGQMAAICYVGPININESMVADGWALADRRAGDDFVRAETFAKSRREGLWRTEFITPWQWRLIH